ncbi:conserved hypothetical protein [Rippkaea orientalis PCC 8801]|uniref:Uncharacterized protein n=1 Tax=Rippkaea orientalis (strain PCC 8801 / RF-1) TaxID=41431 RepID=B7K2G2_RIPO1|nr:hypothetical protein [Rippkaea orientalis]ACK66355.1 conserved hypothetical protein [Rippkaea orientalis PCC 8801]
MEKPRLNLKIFIPVLLSIFTALPSLILAQETLPNQPGLEDNSTNIDDLSNDPQQLKIWRCSQEEQVIAVEAKDNSIWQEMIEKGGWQCLEALSAIPGGDRKFSCEPQNTLGLVTVFWLEGKGAKQQMSSWMTELENQKGMTCTKDETNPFWQ